MLKPLSSSEADLDGMNRSLTRLRCNHTHVSATTASTEASTPHKPTVSGCVGEFSPEGSSSQLLLPLTQVLASFWNVTQGDGVSETKAVPVRSQHRPRHNYRPTVRLHCMVTNQSTQGTSEGGTIPRTAWLKMGCWAGVTWQQHNHRAMPLSNSYHDIQHTHLLAARFSTGCTRLSSGSWTTPPRNLKDACSTDTSSPFHAPWGVHQGSFFLFLFVPAFRGVLLLQPAWHTYLSGFWVEMRHLGG